MAVFDKFRLVASTGLLVALGLFAACTTSPVPASQRYTPWAKPLTRPGLGNLFEVTPNLLRGQQPASEGFAELAKMGVRTVINLRSFGSDLDEIREAGLADDTFQYEPLPMVAWDIEDEQVVRFLKIATDPQKQPVFVHCTHGADRTGTMIASYRMVIQGWTAEQAICEMIRGGFGFHEMWAGLPKYLRSLDVAKIRRRLRED